MKKVLAIVFLGSLAAVSCSKKADNSLQDSNIMLEEPEAQVVSADSTKKDSTPAPAAAPAPTATDSTATK